MADSRREYTAIFSIGARLLGTFRGTMSVAQARLRGLQRVALGVATAFRRLAIGLTAITGIIGTLGVAKVFRSLFEGSADAAIDAHQRVRKMVAAFMQLNAVKKGGEDLALKQVAILQKQIGLQTDQGVLSDKLRETMAAQLAWYRIPPKQISQALGPLADLLVAMKGVKASEEDIVGLTRGIGLAIRQGNVQRGLKQFLPTIDAKYLKGLGTFQQRFEYIMKLAAGFRGAEAKAALTAEGRIQRMQNNLERLRRQIGEEILPVQAAMADAWARALPQMRPLLLWSIRKLGDYAERAVINISDLVAKLSTPTATKNWNDIATAFEHISAAAGQVKGPQVYGPPLPPKSLGAMAGDWLNNTVMPGIAKELEADARTIGFMRREWYAFMRDTAGIRAGLEVLGPYFSGAWDGVKEGYNNLVNAVNVGAQAIIDATKSIGAAIRDFLMEPIRQVQNSWNMLKASWANRPTWLGGSGGSGSAAPAPSPAASAAADIPAFQGGGIVRRSMLARVGERGPEAIIPLTGGMHARGLLEYAARALGVNGMMGRGTTTLTFAPHITINGDATESEQRAMDSRLRDLCSDFLRQFKAAQAHERRLSYESGYG